MNSTSPIILEFFLFEFIPTLKNGKLLKSKAFILSEVPFLCEQLNLKFAIFLRMLRADFMKTEEMLVVWQRFNFLAIITFSRLTLTTVMLNWKLLIFITPTDICLITYRDIIDIPQNQKSHFRNYFKGYCIFVWCIFIHWHIPTNIHRLFIKQQFWFFVNI